MQSENTQNQVVYVLMKAVQKADDNNEQTVETNLGKTDLPAWLINHESYMPPADHANFIRRNLNEVGGLLSRVQEGGGAVPDGDHLDRALGSVMTSLRLLGLLAVILSVNLTQNMLFSYCVLAISLVMLAMRPAQLMMSILIPSLAAALIVALLSLPGVVVGQVSGLVYLSVRVFITSALTVSLARTIPWNHLLSGFSTLRCPYAVIHLLNMTVHFISILGQALVELLDALSVRSIGRDSKKMNSAGNILGVVFLRAHRHANEMSDAMMCRGFDGVYRTEKSKHAIFPQVAYTSAIVALVLGAVYLG